MEEGEVRDFVCPRSSARVRKRAQDQRNVESSREEEEGKREQCVHGITSCPEKVCPVRASDRAKKTRVVEIFGCNDDVFHTYY